MSSFLGAQDWTLLRPGLSGGPDSLGGPARLALKDEATPIESSQAIFLKDKPDGGSGGDQGYTNLLGGIGPGWLLDQAKDHSDRAAFLTKRSLSAGQHAPSSQVDRVAAAARNAGTSADKAIALAKETKAALAGGGNVCRHHAFLLHRASEKLGFPSRYIATGIRSGHCWNIVTIDGKNFWIDAFNDIVFEK
ncbi:MAG: hypothetical protein HYV15_04125 [Elusimicrobia bacterium]|nr:hypothetical protein [Elusimicrobiota bacterium]